MTNEDMKDITGGKGTGNQNPNEGLGDKNPDAKGKEPVKGASIYGGGGKGPGSDNPNEGLGNKDPNAKSDPVKKKVGDDVVGTTSGGAGIGDEKGDSPPRPTNYTPKFGQGQL